MEDIGIVCVNSNSINLDQIHDEICTMVPDNIIIKSVVSEEEALDTCASFSNNNVSLALVIVDHTPPEIKGDRLLEKIDTLYPEAYKVIITESYHMDAIGYAILNANLFRYFTKSWDRTDMLLTIQNILKGFKNNKELQSYKKELEFKVEQRTQELVHAIQRVHEYAFYTLVDEFGIILESSKSFASICGVKKEEIIGKSLFDTIAFASYETTEKIKLAMSERIIFEGEVLHQYLDHRSLWTDIKITPNKTQNEKTTFSIKRHDISDKKHIEELCDIDVLTGLYNRRFFNTLLPKELQRIQREKISFAFLMIDVDNFKKYNDTYGHQKGDEALSIFASVLQNVTQRGSDFAFRLGGEEFAIIISDIAKENIEYYANSINKKLHEKKVLHESSDVSKYLTASVGGIFYEDGLIADDLHGITYIADKLLYQAKKNGRNQVVLEMK